MEFVVLLVQKSRHILGSLLPITTNHGTSLSVDCKYKPYPRRAERALPGVENGKSQSCNWPETAILLALHFLCMHDSGHTHQAKHRILRMQVCSEHLRWAHAQLMHLHTQD